MLFVNVFYVLTNEITIGFDKNLGKVSCVEFIFTETVNVGFYVNLSNLF